MRSNPFVGRYLFHLHTTYTDGQVAVREYFEYAVRMGLERLIFLEHIRTSPRYDVQQFVAEVRALAAHFGVPTLLGFEAKILPGGALDIADEHAAMAEVVGIAEHGFPDDYELWRTSVRTALERWAGDCDKPVVWVHPGLWLKKHGLLQVHEQAYRELVDYVQELGVMVERNLRYDLIPAQLMSSVHPEQLVLGADAHRLSDAEAAVAALH